MPRKLALSTKWIYWWAWRWPWASASDIVRVTGLKANIVSNVLSYGENDLQWLVSARLGRTSKAVNRFVLTNKGIEEIHARFGWEIFWWHTADSVRAMARRLEVLEMAYRYLPDFWRSNAVSRPSVYVYYDRPSTTRTGEPTTRPELLELNWREAQLAGFQWLKTGPFEAVATYSSGSYLESLALPVLWRGSFQKPSDIASVRRDMEQVMVEDERWDFLPEAQKFGHYFPGMIIFCPDRVSAAVVQRNWLESSTRRQHTAVPAIIDAQGQVIRAMDPPTSLWTAIRRHRHGGDQDIAKTVASLGNGAYAAVNGLRAWTAFRAVDGSPGVTRDQIAESMGVGEKVARALLEPMVKARVITLQADSHYLDVSGRGLLADSQRRSRSGVKRRWGVYEEPGGQYARAQRLHNQGQISVILALRRHGYDAFPTMGIVIEASYWAGTRWRSIRVAPDGCVLLPPGVVVFLEYERSAQTPKALERKARNYMRLAEIGCPVPVLFITDSAAPRNLPAEEAAKRAQERSIDSARNLASLQCPMLLAADMGSVQAGPHGKAVIQDHVNSREPGCWWYQYSNLDAPVATAAIHLGAQIYAQDPARMAWRMPLDNPFRVG